MTKAELKNKTDAAVMETKTALQTVYNALNQGQQKKLLKNGTSLKEELLFCVQKNESKVQ